MKYLFVGFVILVLDQASKLWVVNRFSEGDSVPLIAPFLYLTYVINPGAAFGFLRNQRFLLVGAGLLVIGLVWHYRELIAKQGTLAKWGILLGVSGAIGNLIDRIRLGTVIDFIDVRFWPVFNVADIAIVIGVALLFWEVLTDGRTANKS